MAKLEVFENKKLKLVNILIKEFKDIPADKIEDCLLRFSNFIEVSKIMTKGPYISHTLGSAITDEGDLRVDYNIMVQTVQKINSSSGLIFKDCLEFNNCLYLRYQGNQEDLEFAFAKLDVYIFEHDYLDKGEQLVIYVNSDTIDIFKPVELIK